MQFSARVINSQNNKIVNICDPDLLGKTIVDDDLNITISKGYYGEKIIDESEAKILLENSTSINMVGENTISFSIGLGIGSKDAVKKIDNIPFLIVFKM
jgi:hypothetical protein|tara:strand:+ start:280 stop:576 length:297 start_codon:yes stop_codon:yes gene_type:complete